MRYFCMWRLYKATYPLTVRFFFLFAGAKTQALVEAIEANM